jgi:hypothetical protein
VELQKTWLETETLRFRQYLGTQYQNPKNIVGANRDSFALPMVAIYLLGHRVGDIEEPVLYVQHKAYDYEGHPVTKGIPNPFVDSLTHDSIIVQIPRLHGQVNTRLDKVLSIFDQTHKSKESQQVLTLDDSLYEDDADMKHIVHRLLMASTDADVRQDMNVEDEYFAAIEKRDTEIMLRDRKLAEQQVQLNEQQVQLSEQQVQLSEQQVQLSEQQVQLSEQQKLLGYSIQIMQDNGLSLEAISAKLGKSVEELKELLQHLS